MKGSGAVPMLGLLVTLSLVVVLAIPIINSSAIVVVCVGVAVVVLA